MSYLALARKYRPQTFDEIVYQGYVVKTLKNAIELNRISHAYLFTGPRGIGKTSTARIFAKALNCLNPEGVNPCNNCENCVEITNGTSLDVYEIDGASNRGIDEIRQLRESVKFLPTKSKYKIYIIDEVHMLTEAAFNALLKTLEEPPPYVIFIFATTDAHRIPATILSRCQRFNFSKIPDNFLLEHIKQILNNENIEYEDDALNLIVRNSDGCVRDCLSLLDQIVSYTGGKVFLSDTKYLLGLSEDNIINELFEKIILKDKASVKRLLNDIDLKGLDYKYITEKFLSYTKTLLLLINFGDSETLILTDEEKSFFNKIKESVNESILYAFHQVLLKILSDLKFYSFEKDIFEIGVFKLLNLEKIIPLNKFGSNDKLGSSHNSIKEDSSKNKAITRLTDKDELWKNFIDKIGEKRPNIASNLGYGYLIDVSNNQLIIGFSQEKVFHYNIIMKSTNFEYVKKAAEHFFDGVKDVVVKLENGSKKKGVIEKVAELETFKEKMAKKELQENSAVKLIQSEFEAKIIDIELDKS
ncbi:DNA polymerase III subunit gamma/tau [Deferribacter thermophilus]|uniref:DNA polymerase III subunit gamma/tau n=1 Tax=Deferribacter thermophilus TaxID=53573 RepID=UPI003C17ADC0